MRCTSRANRLGDRFGLAVGLRETSFVLGRRIDAVELQLMKKMALTSLEVSSSYCTDTVKANSAHWAQFEF